MSQPPGDRDTMCAALEALGTELLLAAEKLDGLELRLGAGSAAASPELALETQALDTILQHLNGLAEFTARLASRTDPSWRVRRAEAAEGLRLGSQKARLSGEDVAGPTATAGEFELL